MNAAIGGEKSPSGIFPPRNFMQPQKPLASLSLSGGAALASALGFKLEQKSQINNAVLTKP